MIVVVEGPDNAGKTTVAQRLAKSISAIYIKSEIKPTGPLWVNVYQESLQRFETLGPVVTDRHPVISEAVYGPILRDQINLSEDQISRIRRKLFVVYCRPSQETIINPETFTNRDQLAGVAESLGRIIDAYDTVLADANIGEYLGIYRYDWKALGSWSLLIRSLRKTADALGIEMDWK